jgi:hypothetical protein
MPLQRKKLSRTPPAAALVIAHVRAHRPPETRRRSVASRAAPETGVRAGSQQDDTELAN